MPAKPVSEKSGAPLDDDGLPAGIHENPPLEELEELLELEEELLLEVVLPELELDELLELEELLLEEELLSESPPPLPPPPQPVNKKEITAIAVNLQEFIFSPVMPHKAETRVYTRTNKKQALGLFPGVIKIAHGYRCHVL